MSTCFDVANFFLSKIDPEVGEIISNLKLQKMVYYAQGFALADLGRPLFQDTIEAWEHGPVVPALYHEYKQYGAGEIPPASPHSADDKFTSDELELLEDVHAVYGQFSAWKLRNMTHEEQPWIDAIDDNKVIDHESMKKFFKTLID
ncbi:Panacea domain-containing protein [Solidesulfovibrio sp.]